MFLLFERSAVQQLNLGDLHKSDIMLHSDPLPDMVNEQVVATFAETRRA